MDGESDKECVDMVGNICLELPCVLTSIYGHLIDRNWYGNIGEYKIESICHTCILIGLFMITTHTDKLFDSSSPISDVYNFANSNYSLGSVYTPKPPRILCLVVFILQPSKQVYQDTHSTVENYFASRLRVEWHTYFVKKSSKIDSLNNATRNENMTEYQINYGPSWKSSTRGANTSLWSVHLSLAWAWYARVHRAPHNKVCGLWTVYYKSWARHLNTLFSYQL